MTGLLQRMVAALAVVMLLGQMAAAQSSFSALARVDARASQMAVENGSLVMVLGLSQPVPWRLRFLADPPRLVVDFREVDFTGLDLDALGAGAAGVVTDLRAGPVRSGWSRLVLALDGPRKVGLAELRTGLNGGDGAALRLRLDPASDQDFAAEVARPDPPGWTLPRPAVTEAPRPPRGQGPLVVMLDPGHGGLDPGAEHSGQTEARLMLLFARELKDALVRTGSMQVLMTREDDSFVPLETRVALAHRAGAQVFVSLHADAVPEGVATGATVYTLAPEASDHASAALAERHDRDALMSGVDLTGQDDLIAGVLMDMARTETAPRADRLSTALVGAIRAAGLPLHKRPQRGAAFSVLKAPDIPSVLIEVGYMSSPRDLARLTDPAWRAGMIAAIVAGLGAWAVDDAASAGLLRQ